MNGQFVISLDFEKYWGIFDSPTSKNYDQNLNSVDEVVDQLLVICDKYKVKLTFATVGFLFNKTKQDFVINTPTELPSYTNKFHSPYSKIGDIGDNELNDKRHYANYMLKKILDNGNHEIGTHTYCHYYCLEEGQTVSQFDADLKMALKVGTDLGVNIKSIVFPRNQVNKHYLEACCENGITSYRGHENNEIYKPKPYKESKRKLDRILRLLDAYINITGNHIYDLNELKSDKIVNIPSSYFLRPYNDRFSFVENLKINRVKKGMKRAAKQNKLYHLWFHPHNFGNEIEKNFQNFEKILKYFAEMNSKYNFESTTMTQLSSKILDDY